MMEQEIISIPIYPLHVYGCMVTSFACVLFYILRIQYFILLNVCEWPSTSFEYISYFFYFFSICTILSSPSFRLLFFLSEKKCSYTRCGKSFLSIPKELIGQRKDIEIWKCPWNEWNKEISRAR